MRTISFARAEKETVDPRIFIQKALLADPPFYITVNVEPDQEVLVHGENEHSKWLKTYYILFIEVKNLLYIRMELKLSFQWLMFVCKQEIRPSLYADDTLSAFLYFR